MNCCQILRRFQVRCLATGVSAAILAVVLAALGPGAALAADADPTVLATDETAPESDAAHNSNPSADLTTLHAWIAGAALDTLVVALDFSSSWDGMHLMVILETNGDAAGATSDPFGFHVNYGHTIKPDYVFTYKYTAQDYADLRRWNGHWEFWQLLSLTWTTNESDPGKNAVSMVSRSGTKVLFRFPTAAVGSLVSGDTLRLEAYVSQESGSGKYNALDSSPHDATHDMLPPSGDWWQTATATVSLSNYASLGLPAFGMPPALSDPAASPSTADPGDDVLLTVGVTSAGGGIGLVHADLSELAGDPAAALNDAGLAGDELAGDGVYSLRFSLSEAAGGGAYDIVITARDSTNIVLASTSAPLVVHTEPVLVISEKDRPGDDHGPNKVDPRGNPVPGLYYFYPTNAVFKQGAFDLRRADFSTDGQFLVVRLYLGNVLSNQEVKWNATYPGPSCTSANKAELNLQKIDIYMDAREGEGATAGLPNRYVDIAPVDAWEYVVAVEGWWVGLVRSNGSNSRSNWTYFKPPQDISICNDYVEDYVDIKIALAALGKPTNDQLKTWDFMITMAGHDGDSNDQNLGGTRPVNASTAEWQFGGGRNNEGGRERDANIIDVLPISGRGEGLGRSQEDMLDYTTPEASARFSSGKVACLVEASSEAVCSVWGRVALDDTSDASTTVTVDAYRQGNLVGSTRTRPGGGSYCLAGLPDGTYDIEARGASYKRQRLQGIVIQGGGAVADVNFSLIKVFGAITGRISLKGPERDVRIYALDALTGNLSGEGIKVLSGSDDFEILGVEDGNHKLIAQARGYASFDSLVTISSGDTVNATVNLDVARATKYVFIGSVIDVAHSSGVGLAVPLGNEIYSEEISQSLPEKSFFDYAHFMLEPRNAWEDAAIFDAYATDSVALSASLLDPSVPCRGSVIIADSLGQEIPGALLRSSAFDDGVGHFYVRDDSVEVLRVLAARGAVEGAVELGVRELRPARIRLDPDRDSIAVGGAENIKVGVQLLDEGGNPVPVGNVALRMRAMEGYPIFGPEAGVTDANGYFEVRVYGYKSGPVAFTAQTDPDTLPSDIVTAFFRPGPGHHVSASVNPAALQKGADGLTSFQIADRFENPVPESGVRIDLTASPAGRLELLETPLYTDGEGKAQGALRAGQAFGVVSLSAAAAYPVNSVKLWIDPRLVAIDEQAPESDPDHNSNPDVDLTTLFAWIKGDTLKVALDFRSTWEGVHLMIALENKGDPGGGVLDPFEFPVTYEHPLKPDYVFTYKYTANDYADLRRRNGTSWEYWQLAQSAWTTNEGDAGKNAVSMVSKGETQVEFGFPMNAIGLTAPGDTLRLEAYVTQEGAGGKYTALDSDPHDITHDMEPASGNWYDTATDTVRLGQYVEFGLPVSGAAPALSDPKVLPSEASPGDTVTPSVDVADAGGGIGDVLADLSRVGGDDATRLNDDGLGGDSRAGDGTYSVSFTIPEGVSQGSQTIGFSARDGLNISEEVSSASLEIINPPTLIKVVEDSLGDDHGPSLRRADGTPGDSLYYVYPTNGVFDQGVYDPARGYNVGGVFDIEKAEFFIDGSFLTIRVHVGNVPSSEAVGWNATYPGVGCTDPQSADLNLQKIDIYIDSRESVGATAGLPQRFVDVATSDAWEYAVAIEGWWKGLVASNGANSVSLWTIRKLDAEMDFCDDHVENYIDVRIGLSVLGNPTAEDILTWDFIITMASHDGESNDANFGGSRWVNRWAAEWQFGGGLDSEANRDRDPNIIDVLAVPGIVPGSAKQVGRSQLDMLNYLADDAKRRFKSGSNACRIEATYSEDISPPEITLFPTDGFAHHLWHTLEYAPIAFWAKITDASDVDYAAFEWRPLGESAWRVDEMVSVARNYWIVDLDTTRFEQNVPSVEIVDGSRGRAFEAKIRARDQYGNEALSPLVTPVVPDEKLAYDVVRGFAGDSTWVFYDGTVVGSIAAGDYDTYDVKIVPTAPTDYRMTDGSLVRSSMEYLGVGRRLEIVGHKGALAESLTALPGSMLFALHYPTYADPQVGDEKKVGLFRFNDLTQRWIGVYGGVNERGNAVAAEIRESGLHALFSDSRLSYDWEKGLSGVIAEPNPFSPNGDGLYDDTRISFFLSRDADWVTLEIYDISGEPVRTLSWQKGLTATGRNIFEMRWDGADDNGKIVPYGIYVLRVEVRFKIAPDYERQNIPIVVLK